MSVPQAFTSIDCENAALALLDDTTGPAWEGEYRIISECLAADDVLPGDSVQVSAPSRNASFSAIVREVDIQVTSAAQDLSEYTIEFANDAAALLGSRFAKTSFPIRCRRH